MAVGGLSSLAATNSSGSPLISAIWWVTTTDPTRNERPGSDDVGTGLFLLLGESQTANRRLAEERSPSDSWRNGITRRQRRIS